MGNGHGDPQSCADLDITVGDGATIRAEQTLAFPASEVRTLAFESTSHTGIHVTGWDQNEYSVVACKAAGARDDASAKALLDQVKLQRNAGTLSVTGPDQDNDDRRWTAVLLVKAPRNAALSLRVKNGPLSLNGMNGSGTLEAKNGPISLRDSAGQFDIDTQNGPISIDGRAGRLKLSAHNGPIEVNVSGTDWNGELSGEAHNGPIQLTIPRQFNSGVEVTNSRGPMECTADACKDNGASGEEGEHRIRIGGGNTVIRLSTENGPVMVVNGKSL
jgi:Putative adhesin